jgi:hypothetical protein
MAYTYNTWSMTSYVSNMHPFTALQELLAYHFTYVSTYDNEARQNLNKIESVDSWSKYNIASMMFSYLTLGQKSMLSDYLDSMVLYVNAHPQLCNTHTASFSDESKLWTFEEPKQWASIKFTVIPNHQISDQKSATQSTLKEKDLYDASCKSFSFNEEKDLYDASCKTVDKVPVKRSVSHADNKTFDSNEVVESTELIDAKRRKIE